MISRYAGKVHIDTDSVLLGEIAFAPFNRLIIRGIDLGPKAMYSMGVILIVNLTLVIVFFKELKISIFDVGLASVLGFSPILVQYGLMASVSVTVVGAFEAVGSILVIAFMIGPPVTAYLLTDDLKSMIVLSGAIGALNAVVGFFIANTYDVSIAGSMALMTGITFMIVFMFSPSQGVIVVYRRKRFQKIDFAQKAMLFHIMNHENSDSEHIENSVDTIYNHLNWNKEFINKLITRLIDKEQIVIDGKLYKLTERGRTYTIKSYEAIVESFNKEYE